MSTPEIKNKELHRIVTTTLVYKFGIKHADNKITEPTYLITKRALHKKSHPGKWTIPG